jgi:glycosyltransferase involved in cell wall biosynthesis
MATGTPIVSNVRGELQTLLDQLGTAVMIEPNNLNALVEALETLARSPARRQALVTAAAKAAKQYDRVVLADKLLDALLALSNRRATDR